MSVYYNIAWLAVGVLVAAGGFFIFKKKRFDLIHCVGKEKVKDKDNFSDFFGKAITFVGVVTAASSVLCWQDMKYVPVSLILTASGIIYFIFEAFHLVKLYSKEPAEEN